MRIAAYAAGANFRKGRRMPLSNKKLTTEEKIEKSRQYEEDMKRIRERLADIRESKKKLDSEIAEELERAELVTNQTVGKMFRGKMKENLPLEKYGEIIEFIVAVSTYMFHEHNNHAEQKELFMKGYNKMLETVEPSKIICYSEPFDEMTV